ncbi:MAG: hypothetical protein RQ745_12675, partial [Longimicrobiales bacterium]|nr:hypothetical protein [Longimicrobiales bacterium]
AAANGMEDRVRFARGRVPGVALDGTFDVIIFEDFPGLLLDTPTWQLLRELERYAAPGARFLPEGGRISCVPVESPELGERLVPRLEELREFHLEPSLLRQFLANEALRTEVAPRFHLGEPAAGPLFPLFPPPAPDRVGVRDRRILERDATVHALVAWFDLRLGAGRLVSNGPEGESQPWGQYAFPVHPSLAVPAGVPLEVTLEPDEVEDGLPGHWRWSVRAGGEARHGHGLAAQPVGPPDLEVDGGVGGVNGISDR